MKKLSFNPILWLLVYLFIGWRIGLIAGSYINWKYATTAMVILFISITIYMWLATLYTKNTNQRAQWFLWDKLMGEVYGDGLRSIPSMWLVGKEKAIKEYPNFEVNLSIPNTVVTYDKGYEVTLENRMVGNVEISAISKVKGTATGTSKERIFLENIELEFEIEDIDKFFRKTGGQLTTIENEVLLPPNAPWVKRIKSHMTSLLNSFGLFINYNNWVLNSIFSDLELQQWSTKLNISDTFSKAIKDYGLKLVKVQIGELRQDPKIETAQEEETVLESNRSAIEKQIKFYLEQAENTGEKITVTEATRMAREDLQLSKGQKTKQTIEFTGNQIDGWVAGQALSKK